MTLEILAIIAPVGAIALIGFIWDRSKLPFDTNMVTYLVTNVGVPCLILSTLLENRPDMAVLSQTAVAALLIVAVVALAAWAGLKLTGQPLSVYLPALTFPNSGNMGIPLCLFALGEPGLALSVAFFTAMAFSQFTLGVAVASGRMTFGSLVRNPVLWAAGLAVALLLTDRSLPTWMVNTFDSLSGMVIPLMLLSLGISLSRLRPSSWGRSAVFSVARLVLGFAVGLVVAEMLGLTGAAKAAVIIQSAMPTAVFNYLFAARYDNRPGEVAGIVVLSTLMSFLTLPLLLRFALESSGLS